MADAKDPLVEEWPTLNPYASGASLILKRLNWDRKLESWRSRKKIRTWQDKYGGDKAVILCNGPSLLDVDLGLLEGTFTFGLNKINLLFDKSSFRPSCIVAVNSFVIEQNADFYNATEIPLFLDSKGLGLVSARPTVCFLHSTNKPGFARDCSWSICQGHTVTYVAMQLAFHMGFKEVALVGCDHNFAAKGPANQVAIAEDVDKSHFDPNYFAGGVKWHLPDLFESEVAYTRAMNMYHAFGRRIVNSTEGGKLEIFKRQGLAEFLAGEPTA